MPVQRHCIWDRDGYVHDGKGDPNRRNRQLILLNSQEAGSTTIRLSRTWWVHATLAVLLSSRGILTRPASWFRSQTFTKLVNHSTVDPLPDRYETYEEVYHFRTDPRDVNCTVLLSYDPSTVQDPQFGTRPYYQGSPPPIAWYREGQNVDLSNGTDSNPPTMTGRTWMTSLGHTIEIWSDPTHLAHVEAG